MKGVQTFHISGIKGARPFPLSGLHFEGIKGSLVEAESVNAKLEIHQSEAVVWLSCPGADIKDSWVFHKHTLHLLWLPERLCLLGYSFFFPFFFWKCVCTLVLGLEENQNSLKTCGCRAVIQQVNGFQCIWVTELNDTLKFEIFEGKYLDRRVENGCLLMFFLCFLN